MILSYRSAWNERMYNCDALILAHNIVKVWTYSSVFLGWQCYLRVGKDHIGIENKTLLETIVKARPLPRILARPHISVYQRVHQGVQENDIHTSTPSLNMAHRGILHHILSS